MMLLCLQKLLSQFTNTKNHNLTYYIALEPDHFWIICEWLEYSDRFLIIEITIVYSE